MSTAVVQLHSQRFPPVALLLRDVEELMHRYTPIDDADLTRRQLAEHLATGGRRLRARIALASGEALGGDISSIVAWAAAVEMMHNATLIHDDIQDEDRVRRGHLTTWARYGVPQAINVGDLGLMLPFAIVSDMDAPPEITAKLCGLVARHGMDAARGQTLTLNMLSHRQFRYETYRQCIEGTTGAFFALPIEGAALIAGFSPEEAHALGMSFVRLGTLYQLQDDILDLYGKKGRDLPGGDLRAGKVSALVVEHLARKPADSAWLIPLLELPRESTSKAQVAYAAAAFKEAGTLAGCLNRIDAIATAIKNDSALRSWPALRDVALTCMELALEPIESVR